VLKKNILLEGIFSCESPDTSGEVLSVAGADISDLQTGQATLNTEHINPEDADNAEMHKNTEGFQGFNSIVGRVVNAKKIFSDKDCQSDRELLAWRKMRKPMIYGTVEIWDGPDAHDNARAAASIARMFNKQKEGPQLGLSVEGSTLDREGNILKRTVIRKMALTMKPAFREARVDIVEDSAPQVAKSMSKPTIEGGFEPLRKSVAMQHLAVITTEIPKDFGLSKALDNLKKALTAGTPVAAPNALSGGEALQKESQLAKLLKLVGKKSPSVALIKTLVPGISNDDAAKVELAIKKKKHGDNIELANRLYSEIFGPKKH